MQEHTQSYYAATANRLTDHPVLQGEENADVCIVGGGFTGISTALHLAERGYSVAVLEANRIGWGASGRNGGQLLGGFSGQSKIMQVLGEEGPRIIWQLGMECVQIVREWVEKYHIDCDLKWGYFDAAHKQRHLHDLVQMQQELEDLGYGDDLQFVDSCDLASVIGSKTYIGGLINKGFGHLHPLNLCLGEARAAADKGVKIFAGSPVTKFDRGNKPRVYSAAGSVSCDYLVFAGNAYLAGLVPELRGMVMPAGSYIIATQPLEPDLAAQILPQDMAVCDQNVVLDYYRLSADKRLLFGGRCNYSGRQPRSIKATLYPRMINVFPQLKGKRIDYEWGGNIGITVSRAPQLGRIGKNIFYAQGYSGHGVAPTHISSRLLAEAISGFSERFDVFERLRHVRLPGGRLASSSMLALGMLYYRLRDVLT